jgi:dihydroflavonol-4-reductase
MQLTVLNPGMVLGPPLDEHYGMSLQVIERFIGGRDPLLPRVDIPIVDVRDVARVHIGVLGEPATVGERIALNAGTLDTVDAVRTIAAVYPQRRIPARPAPDWLIRLAGRFSPLARQAAGNLDRNCHVDGSKAERLMRFTYVPAERALLASAEFIAAHES